MPLSYPSSPQLLRTSEHLPDMVNGKERRISMLLLFLAAGARN